jgi:flagellum-specific peptidoglycan hydrolase FlgJ
MNTIESSDENREETRFQAFPHRFQSFSDRAMLLNQNLRSPDVALLNVAQGFEPTLTVALCHLAIAQKKNT